MFVANRRGHDPSYILYCSVLATFQVNMPLFVSTSCAQYCIVSANG